MSQAGRCKAGPIHAVQIASFGKSRRRQKGRHADERVSAQGPRAEGGGGQAVKSVYKRCAQVHGAVNRAFQVYDARYAWCSTRTNES